MRWSSSKAGTQQTAAQLLDQHRSQASSPYRRSDGQPERHPRTSRSRHRPASTPYIVCGWATRRVLSTSACTGLAKPLTTETSDRQGADRAQPRRRAPQGATSRAQLRSVRSLRVGVASAMAAAAAARRRSSDSRAQSSVSVVRVLGGMSGVPVLLLGNIFLATSPLLGRSPADSI